MRAELLNGCGWKKMIKRDKEQYYFKELPQISFFLCVICLFFFIISFILKYQFFLFFLFIRDVLVTWCIRFKEGYKYFVSEDMEKVASEIDSGTRVVRFFLTLSNKERKKKQKSTWYSQALNNTKEKLHYLQAIDFCWMIFSRRVSIQFYFHTRLQDQNVNVFPLRQITKLAQNLRQVVHVVTTIRIPCHLLNVSLRHAPILPAHPNLI